MKGFAKTATLQIFLIKKTIEYIWNDACESAFRQLKQCLSTTLVLTMFGPVAHNKVWGNTSNYAVQAVLIQQNTPDSSQQPVEWLSERFNASEQNYSEIDHKLICLM